MIGSERLTGAIPDKAVQRNTVPGMASWGGDGPAGTTCRECEHWHKPEKSWQRWSSETGARKPQRCDKACRMMRAQNLPAIDHTQPSCRFFVLNVEAPPVHRPHR